MERKISKPGRSWLDIQLQALSPSTRRVSYGAVAFAIIMAMVMFDAFRGGIGIGFFHNPAATMSHSAMKAVDRLLLVLMFLKMMRTIQVIFGEEFHRACVEPFFLVGIIAFIRRILIISSGPPHGSEIVLDQFNAFMIETAVLGILVIIFIFGVVLPRRSSHVEGAPLAEQTSFSC